MKSEFLKTASTGSGITPILIFCFSSVDKMEGSIFHQWAKLENSFTNGLDSVTTSTPRSITRRRRNSESSFTSSIDASLDLEKDNFWTRRREEQKNSKLKLVFSNNTDDFISTTSKEFATLDKLQKTKRPNNAVSSPEIEEGSVHPFGQIPIFAISKMAKNQFGMGWSNAVLGRY